jgi:hypothetical protein
MKKIDLPPLVVRSIVEIALGLLTYYQNEPLIPILYPPPSSKKSPHDYVQ